MFNLSKKQLYSLKLKISLIFVIFAFSFSVKANANSAKVIDNNFNNKIDNKINVIKKVAIIQSIEHPALDQTRKGILDELAASDVSNNSANDVTNYTTNNITNNVAKKMEIKTLYESAQGDISLARQIAQKFISIKPDAIVSIATSVSQIFVKLTKTNKIPVIFSSVTDPISANLVSSLEKPGANITGVSNYIDVEPQIKIFKEILPNLKKLGFIYNPGEINSVKLLKLTESACKELDINLISQVASETADVSQATSSIIDKVDAIFITNDNTALSAFKTIVKIANKAKKPVFVSDVDIVDKGAIAAFGPDQYKLGRKTGKMVLDILAGKNPKNIAVGFPRNDELELIINLDAAKKIDLKISNSLITRANKVLK